MKNTANNQTEIQDRSSEGHIQEIARLKIKNDKSSKLVAPLKKELSELGDKLKKKTNENEVFLQESSEAKNELSLFQLYKNQPGSAQPSTNSGNQVKGLHQEKIVEKRMDRRSS